MIYLKYLLLLPLALFVSLSAIITAPIACLFVNRYNNLIGIFHLWETPDHKANRYWTGGYYKKSIFPYIRNTTQEEYLLSKVKRYAMRVMWLTRNSGYGFSLALFSTPAEDENSPLVTIKFNNGGWLKVYKHSFQLKGVFKILPKVYNDVNIGWKSLSKGTDRRLLATRIIGIRIK